MKISSLIENAKIINRYNDLDIRSISLSSSGCSSGSLFFAVKGSKADGNDFIYDALKRGAVAVVTEKKLAGNINSVRVKDERIVVAKAAKRFFMHGSIKIAGITGTNGKTTCTYLMRSILKADGRNPGLIGTIKYEYSNLSLDPKLTTPDPITFWKIVSTMKKDGADFVIVEVSSHSISQNRIYGIKFSEKLFTNLSQDHLDYYKTLENYEKAKMAFFLDDTPSIINGDSATGKKIIAQCSNAISYGFEKHNFIHPSNYSLTKNGINANIKLGKESFEISSPLLGSYNLYNIMAAIGFGAAESISTDKIRKGISDLKSVPGRIEKIQKKGIDIYIDYAHTPDALYNVGNCIKDLNYKKIVTVFGAGGDRDKTKRPLMAEAVERFSDFAIVTSDNPRTEDPLKIIKDVTSGFHANKFSIEPDRKQAIKQAIEMANTGYAVLIAGKGHETYQIIGNKRIYYDDRIVVKEILNADTF